MSRKTVIESRESRPRPARKPPLVPGKLIIRWKLDTPVERAPARSLRGARSRAARPVGGPLEFLRQNYGLRRVVDLGGGAALRRTTSAARGPSLSRHVTTVARSLRSSNAPASLQGVTLVELDPGANVRKAARELSDGAIAFAEPVPNRWTSAQPSKADPRLNEQWGLPAIEWFVAKRPNASHVGVAVIDSGIDETHPDLKQAISHYDTGGASKRDLKGHGTHVSGIIGARTNNKKGIAGVANCRLHCWKVFKDTPADDPDFDAEAYFKALAEAARGSKIDVVNLSIGGFETSQFEDELLQALIDADRVLVAAMGNEYEEGNPIEYPAASPGVLAVGAIGQGRRRARFSNTGAHIGLMAPGVSILSTLPLDTSEAREDDEIEYFAWPGTSMATPFVSGVAALLRAKFPRLSGKKVVERLLSKTTKLDGMNGKNWTSAYGSGLLSVKKGLA
jgi:subtilisin family serine protease